MDRYVDINLRPDPEFASTMLMNALFRKLHRALVESQRRDIGVSFPKIVSQHAGLGTVLRLHGKQGALNALMQTCWLNGMHDHISLGHIQGVPGNVRYRVVKRVQPKSNPERLRRRHIRRHHITETQARERIPDDVAESVNLPFVEMRSGSTAQTFRIFIDQGSLENFSTEGEFSSYGLSAHTTIPWF